MLASTRDSLTVVGMHTDEINVPDDVVRRLVDDQFPEWTALSLTRLPPWGTDHQLFRLGDELLVRMPRIGWAVDQVETDRRFLPLLAPHLPLGVPAPVAVGEPGPGYPWRWSVTPWFPGDNPTADNHAAERTAADLAEFVVAMHAIDPTGGELKTGTSRGVPLAARDEVTRSAIAELGDRVDQVRVTAAWENALDAAEWSRPPVWVHGDLQAGNLVVERGRLTAVIDFGGLGLGDPAVDVMPAWSLFDDQARATFRTTVDVDDDTWRRGRGWALSTALIALPYYWDTFPAMVAESQRKIDEVLAS